MTMYYSQRELNYAEEQRMRRAMEAAAKDEIDLKQDEDGVYRYVAKNGKNWLPA